MRLSVRLVAATCALALTPLAAGAGEGPVTADLPADRGGLAPFYGRWAWSGPTTVTPTRLDQGGSGTRSAGEFGAAALFGRNRWRDYRASIRRLSGSDAYTLLLRAADPGNCIQFGRYGSALNLWLVRGGAVTRVAGCDAGAVHEPETLEGEIIGDEFVGRLDGRALIRHRFAPGEAPAFGRPGLQANHGARFDQLAAEVISGDAPRIGSRRVTAPVVRLAGPWLGRQTVVVEIEDDAGASDIASVVCRAEAVGARLAPQRVAVGDAPLTISPLRRVARLSATRSRWEAAFFALFEGRYRFTLCAADADDGLHAFVRGAALRARPGTFVTVGRRRLYESLDPHPLWRALCTASDPGDSEPAIPNYLWQTEWGREHVTLRPMALEAPGANPLGRRAQPDSGYVAVRPVLTGSAGTTLAGAIVRRLAEPTTLFGLQPGYTMETPDGTLEWWVRVQIGDPIVRFGGRFVPRRDGSVTPRWEVRSGFGAQQELIDDGRWAPCGDWPAGMARRGWALWRPAGRERGPLLAWSVSRRAGGASGPSFTRVPVRAGKPVDLPVLAAIVVDGDADYSGAGSARALAERLSGAAMAVPELRAGCADLPAAGAEHRLVLRRAYHVAPNDRGAGASGQLMALPWAAGAVVHAAGIGPVETVHTVFGNRPFVLTRRSEVVLRLPYAPAVGVAITPPAAPLAGDWLANAVEGIDRLAALQNADGTFRKYYRMDHYSLARFTIGLLVGYRGLGARPATQAKVRLMTRRALDRMLGLRGARFGESSTLRRQDVAAVEEQTFRAGDAYEPFAYLPKWNIQTDMGALVDQNLGHAHLIYSLLLYARLVDPAYVRRPDVRARIEELIRFQWLSQDWNGDIWRVYETGTAAAGGGDGYEEDLALVLPDLAHAAGLSTEWTALAGRVAALKYGALRQFDYLPVANEWGFEFLTPLHGPTQWMPESGWNRDYFGDVWYTGPATGGGIYGRWYVDSVLRRLPSGVFERMWYELLEEAKDTIAGDGRHWLTIGGYCSEARLIDPFLGAVKLARAWDVGKRRDYLTDRTEGENIWNFSLYTAAFAMVQGELASRLPWMRRAVPVAGAARSSDADGAFAAAWRLPAGAVVSAAAYRLRSAEAVTVLLDAGRLGLGPGRWRVRDLRTGAVVTWRPGEPLRLRVAPRSATTVRIELASGR